MPLASLLVNLISVVKSARELYLSFHSEINISNEIYKLNYVYSYILNIYYIAYIIYIEREHQIFGNAY